MSRSQQLPSPDDSNEFTREAPPRAAINGALDQITTRASVEVDTDDIRSFIEYGRQ